ncbi:4 TMS phage holin, superfamily IV [Tessaracoccus bendigoensis DSM 12906]|uniref:4 TMS phage holin, superfamily IV n=1 Tax=Tessaracoccus bendigoensis DSM 12906 TaxID=1123357 RepID=A0A1M6HXK4_9ACTN|nr:phage holin family protein [Tessaracoccus bendigoensis]SHJ26807.1 4 TMS phage holin, superfamily IV [Tessaracoccus bendigoensis DSM 12906]
MIRFFVQIIVNLITATLALLLIGLLIEGVTIRAAGLITAVAVFVVANAILAPFVFKMAHRYAPAAIGGVGLLSTVLALFIATLISGGLAISGFMDWVLATLLVWIITAIGGWLVMAWWAKRRVKARQSNTSN